MSAFKSNTYLLLTAFIIWCVFILSATILGNAWVKSLATKSQTSEISQEIPESESVSASLEKRYTNNFIVLMAIMQIFISLELALVFYKKIHEHRFSRTLKEMSKGLLFLLPLFMCPLIIGFPRNRLGDNVVLELWGQCLLFYVIFYALTNFIYEISRKLWFSKFCTQILIFISCGSLFWANPFINLAKNHEAKVSLINLFLWINPFMRTAGLLDFDIVRQAFMYRHSVIAYYQFSYPQIPSFITAICVVIGCTLIILGSTHLGRLIASKNNHEIKEI